MIHNNHFVFHICLLAWYLRSVEVIILSFILSNAYGYLKWRCHAFHFNSQLILLFIPMPKHISCRLFFLLVYSTTFLHYLLACISFTLTLINSLTFATDAAMAKRGTEGCGGLCNGIWYQDVSITNQFDHTPARSHALGGTCVANREEIINAPVGGLGGKAPKSTGVTMSSGGA